MLVCQGGFFNKKGCCYVTMTIFSYRLMMTHPSAKKETEEQNELRKKNSEREEKKIRSKLSYPRGLGGFNRNLLYMS